MRNEKEIKELFEWEQNEHHPISKALQKEDWEYYKDTFPVPSIQSPYKITRLALGTEIIDVPTAYIVTSEPQVYVEATADNDAARERALKRGTFLNHLVDRLTFQNPQPFKESVKNALVRGEGWIHLVNNPDWTGDDPFCQDIPLIFAVPDPIIVYASPDERNGVPDYCFLPYKRYYRAIQNKYEHWKNPQNRKDTDKFADWLVYFDKDIRYFEADGQAILETDNSTKKKKEYGIQKNMLGFVPFVHFYSGYGKSSPEGKPEELAVSRIRPDKGRILAYTELASSVASQLMLYAQASVDMQSLDPNLVIDKNKVEYSKIPGSLNILPSNVKVTMDRGSAPPGEVLSFLQMLRYEITRATPPLMQGISSGGSGRAEDIEKKNAIAQYQSVVDNAATAWGTALSQALHIVKNPAFGLLPLTLRATQSKEGQKIRGEITLKEEDIDDFHCVVKLKAADPIEDKAQAQIGNMMQAQGVIDWETNLVKYHGYSLDEAKEIMVKATAGLFIKNNPALIAAMGMAAMKELGIEVPVNPEMGGAPTQGPIPGQPGHRGGPPRQGNIKSIETLAKDADMQLANRPPRMSPGLGR